MNHSAEPVDVLKQPHEAAQSAGLTEKKRTIESRNDGRESVPPGRLKKAAESYKWAAEVGDVLKVESVNEKLKVQNRCYCASLQRIDPLN